MMTPFPTTTSLPGSLGRICAGAVLCLGLGMGAARANLVVNGSFENPGTNYYDVYSSIQGWTSNNNEFEIDRPGPVGLSAAADGLVSLELNSYTFDTISQTIGGLTAGQKYLLTWAYAGRQGSGNQETDISFNGVQVGKNTSTGIGTQNWTYNSVVVKATGTSAVLSFAAINKGGNASIGNELDAISLNVYVPEPATIALLLTAVAGVVVYRARRRTPGRDTPV